MRRRRPAFGRQDLHRASAPVPDYRLHSSFERGALESVEGLGSREAPPGGGGGGLGALSPEQRAHHAQLAHAHAALLSSPPPGDAFRRHTVHVAQAGERGPRPSILYRLYRRFATSSLLSAVHLPLGGRD